MGVISNDQYGIADPQLYDLLLDRLPCILVRHFQLER